MKRIVCLLLAVILTLTLASCGKNKESEASENNQKASEKTEKSDSNTKGTRNNPYEFGDKIVIKETNSNEIETEYTFEFNTTRPVSDDTFFEDYSIGDEAFEAIGVLNVKSEEYNNSVDMDLHFSFLSENMIESDATLHLAESNPNNRLDSVYNGGKYDIKLYCRNGEKISAAYLTISYREESEQKKLWIKHDFSKAEPTTSAAIYSTVADETTTQKPSLSVEELKKKLDAQEVKITKAFYTVQDDNYKALYPDAMQVLIKNNSNHDIKNAVIAFTAWDKNNLPVKIKAAGVDISDGSYIRKCTYTDINLIPGGTYGEHTGFEVDETCGIKTVKAIIVSYEAFDGTTWENPYYDNWCEIYEGVKLT